VNKVLAQSSPDVQDGGSVHGDGFHADGQDLEAQGLGSKSTTP